MILSVFSLYLFELVKRGVYTTASEAFKHMREIGIEAVEVFDTELSKHGMEEFRKNLLQSDIKVNSLIQLSDFDSKDNSKFHPAVEDGKRLVDSAVKLNSPFVMFVGQASEVVTETDKLRACDKMVEGLSKIVEYATGSGVTITIENFSLKNTPFSTIEEICYLMEYVRGLKYVFDAGNFLFAGEDILTAYETLKPYMVSAHVKDLAYDENGFRAGPDGRKLNGTAVGEGILPLREWIKRLKSDRYNGALTIEYNSSKPLTNEIVLSADFLRREICV